jgi:hypothetical protein
MTCRPAGNASLVPAGTAAYHRRVRSLTFLNPMNRLALIAVLLVALAPSVSRVLASGTTQVLAGWNELCTSAGLAWTDTGATSLLEKSPLPAGVPADADCAYCPLAVSLPLLLLLLCTLFPCPRAGVLLPTPTIRPRAVCNGRGLGGQGPPLLL